ncbi:MAG: phosphotransferase [Anaerolineae bacterium]|nr:phosphotransferase [Anaerolineae bacterium]
MSTTPRSLAIFSITRLIDHLRTPLFRNGYALVFSSVATSGLGVVYWMLAARTYTTEAIGLNSALMSAMIFLANLSQLNLMNALNRFIPSAGRATSRLIMSAYLISAVVAVISSLAFIWGIEIWSPTLGFLKTNPVHILWFVLATVTWCIFVLQDSALTGLRQATWVPIENLFFAIAKILLLVAFAAALPLYGIFASWTVPVLLLLVPINLLIFRHLVPRHIQTHSDKAEPIVLSQLTQYVAGDYFSSLIWMATTNLLPLMVLELAGATANAYFFLAYTIAYSLYLVSRNMGMSLIAEAAADQAKLDEYSYRTLAQTTRLLVPIVVVLVIGTPYLLQLFGKDYSTEGTSLLRLLCLSALPNIVTSLFISIARVQRRMMKLVIVLTVLSTLTIGLSYVLLQIYGIVGVGFAWLFSQTIVAIALLVTDLRSMWMSRLNLKFFRPGLTLLRQLREYPGNRRRVKATNALIPAILPHIETLSDDEPSPETWQVHHFLRTLNDVTVVTLGPVGQQAVAVLKLPQSSLGRKSLQQQQKILLELQNDSRLGSWSTLMPKVLATGTVSCCSYYVEKLMPGYNARDILFDKVSQHRVRASAATTISQLHRLTATPIKIEAAMVERWVNDPINVILGSLSHNVDQAVFNHLALELEAALLNTTFSVSWIHGDFVPENILVTKSGDEVVGIVDWELAEPDSLPQIDCGTLFLSIRMWTQGREIGEIVRDFLQEATDWTPDEQSLLATAQDRLPGQSLNTRQLVLLCWLRHIAANLAKSTHYASHRLWIAKNISSVIHCLK